MLSYVKNPRVIHKNNYVIGIIEILNLELIIFYFNYFFTNFYNENA